MNRLAILWHSYHLRNAVVATVLCGVFMAGMVGFTLRAIESARTELLVENTGEGPPPRFTEAEWHKVEKPLFSALPLAMLAFGLISYYLSYRALLPVRQLQSTTETITTRGLDKRIPEGVQDVEFEGLIRVFNGMLDRLERGFNQANEFSAGAAHELKTPIAILQGEIERGVQESAPGSEEQERYSRLMDHVQRLKTVTRRLLLLATVDAGGLRLQKAPFDLSECLLDTLDDASILAPEIVISKKIPDNISILADGELLPQVVTNLVINAITHNKPGGRLGLRLRESRHAVTLTISNTGPGIPEADRAKLFSRFYRADKSRSRARGGSGLGLSLAREIARAHGGDIFLVASETGVTTFRLFLPKGP